MFVPHAAVAANNTTDCLKSSFPGDRDHHKPRPEVDLEAALERARQRRYPLELLQVTDFAAGNILHRMNNVKWSEQQTAELICLSSASLTVGQMAA